MPAYPAYGASSANNKQTQLPGASSSSSQCGETTALLYAVCPLCGQADLVQRIDSLHAGGLQLPDSARSEFLERFAPPAVRAIPAKTPTYGRAVALFAASGAALNLTGWFLMPWSRQANSFVRFCAGPLLALYLGWLAGAALLMWIKRPQIARSIAEYMEHMRAYEAESALQQRAFLIWNRLFYCQRDNVVFLPGTDESAGLEDMLALCYRLAEQTGNG